MDAGRGGPSLGREESRGHSRVDGLECSAHAGRGGWWPLGGRVSEQRWRSEKRRVGTWGESERKQW
jgi:hypothetical protein